ncbi:sensor domain-containing diguanylate cyclase [Vreelandella subglaciescola]|jgi:diguanylate cyclase (GGDEF)-like protein/PAS domain S-box-containing protein|nr:diguanylate cyclase [Halomonas subglaciescola]
MRKRQIKWTVIVFILLAGILYLGKIPYDEILRTEVHTRHMQLMKTASMLRQEKLLDVVQDARRLALNSGVKSYIETPTADHRNKMQRALINTSNVYGRYDQIRYIDLQGMEQVRVDYADDGAYAVADTILQSKADSTYVTEGLALDEDQVYFSPIDLNRENGTLERPLKPVIRLVQKVTDSDGEPQGLLVLNYAAGEFLNQFRALFPDLDQPMLLNNEGYWLLNAQADKTWGWLLGQPQQTLGAERPALWKKMQTTPGQTMELDGDLFSYQRFDAVNVATNGLSSYADERKLIRGISTSAKWFMLVQTRSPQWHVGAAYLRPWFRVFVVGLFLMAAMLVYFVIASREQRRVSRAAQRGQLADFKDLYENAPIGYVTVSASGLITNVNHMLLAYLGYQREELLNDCYFMDLVDDESRAGLEGLMHSLGAGEHEQYRLEMRCKHGERLTVLCSVSSRLSTSSMLTVGRCSVQDISQQVSLERSLERLAYSDSLTGLANRRHFDELASRELKRLQREGGPLTALALDVDRFKAVNDRYGHAAGDKVLKSLARHGEKLLRGTDILARFGGEEFTVLLPGATQEQGRNKAEALRQALAEAPVTLQAGEVIHYTVSIGVATLARPEETQLPALLKRADEALYQAKRSGRNRVCVAEPEC